MPRKSVWVPPKSYVISVSLGTGCYRHIKIDADSALSQLSSAILDAFGLFHGQPRLESVPGSLLLERPGR